MLRNATLNELRALLAILGGMLFLSIGLQTATIIKATVPADQLIVELRAFRDQMHSEHNDTLQRLSSIEAVVDNQATRAEVVRGRMP